MNKEQIQQAAKDFCEKNIPIVGSDHMIHANVQGTNQVLDLHLFLSGFLQSMIEKGHVVRFDTYNTLKNYWIQLIESVPSSAGKKVMQPYIRGCRDCADSNGMCDTYPNQYCDPKKHKKERDKQKRQLKASAGKEVKTLQELRDKIAVEEYGKEDFEDLFWSWSDMEGNDGYNGISKVYDAAAEMYADQFKSSPAMAVISDQDIESAGKEVKSAKEIIEKYGWHVGDRSSIIPAMEEYASQFKSQPALKIAEVSDQDIERVSKAILENQFDIAGWSVSETLFIASMESIKVFAEWYREQLKDKS